MINERGRGSLDDWTGFISGNFLKAVNVNSENDVFVCTAIQIVADAREGSERPRLTLERNKIEFDFDLNKTNSIFLKNNGIQKPKDIVGAKIFFRKAFVRDPKKNQEVEGLRIWKVEK